jgi:hypothetical protein
MMLLVWWIYWHCFVVVNAVVGIGVFGSGEGGMLLLLLQLLLQLLLLLDRNLTRQWHRVFEIK